MNCYGPLNVIMKIHVPSCWIGTAVPYLKLGPPTHKNSNPITHNTISCVYMFLVFNSYFCKCIGTIYS